MIEALALLGLLHLPSFPRPQSLPEAPDFLPPSFCSAFLRLYSMSRSLWTILQSLRRSPACTSLADLLGCHDSSACNATSSTHSTLYRIYMSTPFSHQSRPHSPRLFLHALCTGSTNPSLTIPDRKSFESKSGKDPGSMAQCSRRATDVRRQTSSHRSSRHRLPVTSR